MKSLILVSLTLFGACLNAYAQTDGYGSSSIYDRSIALPNDTLLFTIPPNEFWQHQPWKTKVYINDGFVQGTLVFANSFEPTTKIRINYNVFLESMDIITEKGDTIVLKPYAEVRWIRMGEKLFLNEPGLGYLEIVVNGEVKLARRTVMISIVETSNNHRAYGTGMDVRTGTSPMTRHYWPREFYYIVDNKDKVHRPGSLTLPNLYPEMRDRIKQYVRANRIDYKKNPDVLKVVEYFNEEYRVIHPEADSAKN